MPQSLQFLADRQKSDSLYDYHNLLLTWYGAVYNQNSYQRRRIMIIMIMIPCITYVKFGWIVHQMTPNQTQGIGHQKYISHMCTIGPRVPNFHPFCSTIIAFFKIFHILGFPIDSHVKMSKCHKICKTWPIAKKSDSLYSTMVANVLIKFGWHWIKTVGGEAFWNFRPHIVLYWEKFQSAIEFLIFGRSPKN